MTIELWTLCFAVLLGIIHITLASAAQTKLRGVEWNLSSREENEPPAKGLTGRLDRALQNYKETFPLFLAAVVVIVASGKSGIISEISACVYLGARILYLPIYAAGITVVRTLIWIVSMLGIIGILTQLFWI